jgi:hypothetical protein
MRIEEEKSKKIKPEKETKPQKEKPDDIDIGSDKNHQSTNCLKTLGCLIVALFLVFIVVCFLIFFIAKPLIEKVNDLPNDFPKELIIYRLEEAKIKIQNQENKLKALKLIESLPSWLVAPFLSLITPDPAGQILTQQENGEFQTKNLEESLRESIEKNEKTVSLSWQLENKSKEDIFNYYSEKLEEAGFELKENISDYNLNLSFLRKEVNGSLVIIDDFTKNNASLIKMTVNYLAK